jgi:hypothetical protein
VATLPTGGSALNLESLSHPMPASEKHTGLTKDQYCLGECN